MTVQLALVVTGLRSHMCLLNVVSCVSKLDRSSLAAFQSEEMKAKNRKCNTITDAKIVLVVSRRKVH